MAGGRALPAREVSLRAFRRRASLRLFELRWMASLISRMLRSISASSSSSDAPSALTLAWMVEAKTSSPSDSVEMAALLSRSSAASHSTASTVTLSLFSPAVRSARSTSSGTASVMERCVRTSVMTVSGKLPHRPSLHSMTRSPGFTCSGPAVSMTGLPGLPRQVKST